MQKKFVGESKIVAIKWLFSRKENHNNVTELVKNLERNVQPIASAEERSIRRKMFWVKEESWLQITSQEAECDE